MIPHRIQKSQDYIDFLNSNPDNNLMCITGLKYRHILKGDFGRLPPYLREGSLEKGSESPETPQLSD